jgi:hypothetical protein
MTVYVDPLLDHGWVIMGERTRNSHMFTDQIDLGELHALAQAIGMHRLRFQDKPAAPHYDLTPHRRALAVAAGAVEVSRREAVLIWRARRAALAVLDENSD